MNSLPLLIIILLLNYRSLNDFSQYHVRGGKLVRKERRTSTPSSGGAFSKGRKGGAGGKGSASGKGGNRPGKTARMERRAASKSKS